MIGSARHLTILFVKRLSSVHEDFKTRFWDDHFAQFFKLIPVVTIGLIQMANNQWEDQQKLKVKILSTFLFGDIFVQLVQSFM